MTELEVKKVELIAIQKESQTKIKEDQELIEKLRLLGRRFKCVIKEQKESNEKQLSEKSAEIEALKKELINEPKSLKTHTEPSTSANKTNTEHIIHMTNSGQEQTIRNDEKSKTDVYSRLGPPVTPVPNAGGAVIASGDATSKHKAITPVKAP